MPSCETFNRDVAIALRLKQAQAEGGALDGLTPVHPANDAFVSTRCRDAVRYRRRKKGRGP